MAEALVEATDAEPLLAACLRPFPDEAPARAALTALAALHHPRRVDDVGRQPEPTPEAPSHGTVDRLRHRGTPKRALSGGSPGAISIECSSPYPIDFHSQTTLAAQFAER